MNDLCKACGDIASRTQELDRRVEMIVARVRALCASVREENDRRWGAFAKRCRGFLGRRFQRKRFGPDLLPEPAYYDEPWYRQEGRAIEEEARTIERLKRGDMEHWGSEIVNVNDGDPHGPSIHRPRAWCYEKGYAPFLPDAYDFSSAAGSDKFDIGRRVMCASTLEIVEVNDCSNAGGKPTNWRTVYWLRSAARPPFLWPLRH